MPVVEGAQFEAQVVGVAESVISDRLSGRKSSLLRGPTGLERSLAHS
jgi:hypothetical protein